MPVIARVLGDLRRFAPADSVEIPVALGVGCTLATAVDELLRHNPRLGGELFDEQGRLRYTSLLILNGQSAAWPQDKDRPLEDGAEVVLTRFYSGG